MDKIVLSKAGKVSLVSRAGEVFDFELPAGVYSQKALWKTLAIGGGHRPVQHPGHFHSAANPRFRMSPGAREARRLNTLLTGVRAQAVRAEKAAAALQRAHKLAGPPAGEAAAAGHEPEGMKPDASSVSAT